MNNETDKYRNKVDITSTEGVLVDSDSLWLRKGELMVLMDRDQYVTHPYDINIFYSVK